MRFHKPNPEQVRHGLRAILTVALADGAVDESEREMMAQVQAFMGTDHDLDALTPITPAELAERIDDPQLAWQLCGALVIASLIDQDADEREAACVAGFADALGVRSREVDNLWQLARGHTLLARLDVARRFWAADKVRERIRNRGLRTLWELVQTLRGKHEDPAMASRYRKLEQLPPGTLGREYWQYMRDNEFPLPGERGAAIESITYHDMTHVLSGYGTSPEEEVLVACFSAGYREKHPLAFVMFVMLQFHLGHQIPPTVPPERGKFNVGGALEALARGAAMTVDLTAGWEYWEVIDQPVETLRERYAIPPRRDVAATAHARS